MNSNLQNRMVLIDFVDDPLPEGCSHTLALRIWIAATEEHEVPRSAKLLALGLLERAASELRKQVQVNPTATLTEPSLALRSGREQQVSPAIRLVE